MRTHSRPDWPRARVYPLLGAALALGAPGGILCLRAALRGTWPSLVWTLEQIAGDPLLYAYLTVSTALVFAMTGRVLGAQADRLRILSNTDPLTDVVNRRGFHSRLVEEMARVERYGTPAALLIVDVDGLKKINDRQGHRTGDAALRALASVLRGCIREPDLVAHVGGDEFAVLAPETKADEALALAGRIRDRLLGGTDACPAFTVSIGVAGARQGDGLSEGEVFSQADEALYAAKRAGGDCAAPADRSSETNPHGSSTLRAPGRQA